MLPVQDIKQPHAQLNSKVDGDPLYRGKMTEASHKGMGVSPQHELDVYHSKERKEKKSKHPKRSQTDTTDTTQSTTKRKDQENDTDRSLIHVQFSFLLSQFSVSR